MLKKAPSSPLSLRFILTYDSPMVSVSLIVQSPS
ncbi:hypothetical protein NSND_60870 [Nitrospira sp. ND1]|nr:hypothetical protein NSND_60870 [Nitrospira sp. ND1]